MSIPWNKGLKGKYYLSEETKRKISESQKKIIHTHEWNKKVGVSNKISLLGNVPWNKGLQGEKYREHFNNGFSGGRYKGYKHTVESRIKMSINTKGKPHYNSREEKNHMWKGNNVSYAGLHHWIKKKFGKANFCEMCGKTNSNKRYNWSNIDGKYKRDVKDWQKLCVPCHYKYDKYILPFINLNN